MCSYVKFKRQGVSLEKGVRIKGIVEGVCDSVISWSESAEGREMLLSGVNRLIKVDEVVKWSRGKW